MNPNKSKFALTALIAALTALTTITTIMIRVPVPATNGYFNIGDVFIIFAGLWLGPLAGFIVGGIGSAIADAIGFPVYILATLVVKGLEGFITGIIASRANSTSLKRPLIASLCGGILMVSGYYLFEAFIYPYLGTHMPLFAITTPEAAAVALFPNSIQGLVGVIGGLALYNAICRKK